MTPYTFRLDSEANTPNTPNVDAYCMEKIYNPHIDKNASKLPPHIS